MALDDIPGEFVKELGKAAAREAWEKKSALLRQLGKVWAFARGRASDAGSGPAGAPRPILIMGPGGTGKSTLARVLGGDPNVLIDPPGFYEPSILPETVPLLGAPGVELVVMPGQEPRLNREFTTVAADLAAGTYRGLVLVVDYGYHSIDAEWAKDHRLYTTGMRDFKAALLAAQQNGEIELLDRLAPSLKAVARKLWVLVVVLKQDLWSRQQDEVVRHYRDGPWGQKMNQVAAAADPKLFFPHTAFASLHIQNYTTKGGRQTLWKNLAGYDAVRQRESMVELFQAFDQLREWEEQE